ncbi:glutathionylspermidine synthase family protein [Campylobacter sp. 19-13652]|uniref:glutathionylspermidine synthase family protein n=1 Tax=Campylobacter sp. 19-13652 TaxID=2840180 RepID=UPI001C73F2C6|nr:glutathionylspermidine synthase family protein [Campylobacter sp. 19-13652]BCX78674.1 glutathionylspermidine synthase [Campylobacter sp. 19-13652]
MKLKKLTPISKDYLESVGFYWHTDNDGSEYIADEVVEISQAQAENYYNAANELYDMYVAAAQYVIDNELFHELGIPFNLVELIKASWENDVHWHLYGRFDLAGGLDGAPIKLIEFNADTPTCLFETAFLQSKLLEQNGLDEDLQFNDMFGALLDNFKRLVTLSEDVSEFESSYSGWGILFSCVRGSIEDEQTVQMLKFLASKAGFKTEFAYIDEISFDDEKGVFYNGENYEFFFKLVPWESIAVEESELALILTNIVKNQKAIILNPAYTLLFQSKGILKILWQLYPDHPLLLEASDAPLEGKKQVKKPLFGREGENVSIIGENGNVIEQTSGSYGDGASVYQEYCELCADSEGRSYQAGVFFAYEACGLGYRRGGKILNNTSKFVGHYIKEEL